MYSCREYVIWRIQRHHTGRPDCGNDPEWMAYRTLDAMNRTVLVVAAGNENKQVGAPLANNTPYGRKGDYYYPASYKGLDNMIVVGGIEKSSNAYTETDWSQTRVHLLAPASGTSMAAPFVSGAIALLASKTGNENISASQLKSHLLKTAKGNSNPLSPYSGTQKISKYGQLDVGAALTTSPAPVAAISIKVIPSAVRVKKGSSVQLAVEFTPEETTDKSVVWTSENDTVASVTNSGIVTLHKDEAVKITATAGNVTAHCIVSPVIQTSGSKSSGGCGLGWGFVPLLPAASLLFARLKRRGN